LVATHADRNISGDVSEGDYKGELGEIKKRSTGRLHRYLEDGVLSRYKERAGREVTVEDLRAQWFPFWAEKEKRSGPLVNRLEDVLGKRLPEVRIQEKRSQLEDLKRKVRDRCDRGATLYRNAAEESAEQQHKVQKLVKKAKEQRERFRSKSKREEVHGLIDTLEHKSRSRVKTIFRHTLRKSDVEELVRKNFNDKNEAKDRAPALLVEKIESEIEEEIEDLNDRLIGEIDEYLDAFEEFSVQADGEGQIEVPFDAQGAFAGGLAGIGAAGGLAAWASQLGPLGGYVIVSQGISALSALGISISGGAAAATAWVAAAGGPVALGAAVAGVAGLAGWRLLAEDWQERLARKIVKYYEEEGLKEEFLGGAEEYWQDTRAAFEAGADAVEEEFRGHLNRLERLTEKEEEALSYAERFEEARDFYSGMPV